MQTNAINDQPAAREGMRELQRMSHRICTLILTEDYPEFDILLERQKMRRRAEEMFPNGMDLYDMIYEARFDRLLEQFRNEEELEDF
ncbi:MAG TPA: hypothetical protein VM223_26200 [Planctomycetota bacterium]|nr:hypothetical protein [Planctomycetota bacterium]